MENKQTKEEMFDSIYRSCGRDVYHAALHITKDPDISYDVTQQAFVNFYKRMDQVNPKCAKHYIINSAMNLANNYLRDTKKEIKSEMSEEEVSFAQLISDTLEEQYFNQLKREMELLFTTKILDDLKRKHDNWYQIIHLMFFMGKNHDEISKELGISKDVLYSRLHRAKTWIRKKYKEDFDLIMEVVM